MNFLSRIRAAAKVSGQILTLPADKLTQNSHAGIGVKMLSGEWEGGESSRFRQLRSTRLVAQDTDLNNGTREALMSEARNLCQNFPVAGAILERFADYCVHPSAKVKFFTTDSDWNEAAADYWANWTRTCDAQGDMTFQQMLRVGIKSMKRDGDVFFHKESDEIGTPKLRAVEGDRVTTESGFLSPAYYLAQASNQAREVGGVMVDARGRKVGYTVCDRNGFGGFVNPHKIVAGEIFHYYSPSRFEAYRGVTAFHTVLNDFRDLKETHDAEKVAAKLASFQTILERNASGAAKGPQAFAEGTEDNAENVQKLEEVAPGLKRYMAQGEDLTMFMSERPSEGWRWFIAHLIRGAAIGLHLPYEFVWDMSGLNGTSVRLASKQAERTFAAEMDNLELRVIDPTVAWVISSAMESGRLPRNAEWYFYKAQRPAHPTVDAGRESAANINELNAGVRTEDSICEEQGNDGYDVRVARAGEVKHRLALAREIVEANPEIPFQQALALMGGANIGPTYGMQQPAPTPK